VQVDPAHRSRQLEVSSKSEQIRPTGKAVLDIVGCNLGEYQTFLRQLQAEPRLWSSLLTVRIEVSEANGQEEKMNWDSVEGKWKQFKGTVKQKWGRLTDDDLDVIAGKRDQLEGKIQERYGITKEEAKKQIDDWNPETSSASAAEPPRERKVS
jgi:uncharacterized protein YjbJ (UPF0337 family)